MPLLDLLAPRSLRVRSHWVLLGHEASRVVEVLLLELLQVVHLLLDGLLLLLQGRQFEGRVLLVACVHVPVQLVSLLFILLALVGD